MRKGIIDEIASWTVAGQGVCLIVRHQQGHCVEQDRGASVDLFVCSQHRPIAGGDSVDGGGHDFEFGAFVVEGLFQRIDQLGICAIADEDAESAEELGEPEDIAAEIQVELRTALEELEELSALLDPEL